MANNKQDPFAVLKISDYRFFILARFFFTFGFQMQAVIVGWQVYEITRDPLALGLIGLAEAIPFLGIALLGGWVADHFNRKKIILISNLVYLLAAVSLLILTWQFGDYLKLHKAFPVYAIIFITGIARAFFFPAQTALIAQIVPRELYANSSTWSSLAWHIAAVGGPAAGGLIYGFSGVNAAYITVVSFAVTGFIMFFLVHKKPKPVIDSSVSFGRGLTSGIRYVFNNQIILSSISLDMFAVLFGGAVAMLPVFASEVLHVGPEGLGMLRAAPAAGAILMASVLAYFPVQRRAGKKLLLAVAGFGVCMILFALSPWFWVSMLLLFLSGVFDNVSVILRSTIIQLFTPDEMRGRVASVNSIFIGSSNEIGSFESGLAAKLLGLIPSVIFGGTMTLLVVGITAKLSPLLRKLNLTAGTKE
jgi:MFS family permease